MKRQLRTTIVLLSLVSTTYAQTHFEHADDLYNQGYYSKAINEYGNSNTSISHEKMALCYKALGNYDKALNHYKQSIVLDSTNTLLRFNYAKLLSKTKQYEAAGNLLLELAQTDKNNPNYHYELGLIKERLRDTSAHSSFLSAYNLDPTHQKTIYKIAKYYLLRTKYDKVHQYANKGLRSYENNVELIGLKAQAYQLQEQWEKAIVQFEKLIELGSGSAFIYEKLGQCEIRNYNNDKAINHLEQALKLSPDRVKCYYLLADLYLKKGNQKLAQDYIETYITAMKADPLDEPYTFLAMVLNRQKKYKQALQALKKALKENPNNSKARFFIVHTKVQLTANDDEKVKLYEAFIKKYPKDAYAYMAQIEISKITKEPIEDYDQYIKKNNE